MKLFAKSLLLANKPKEVQVISHYGTTSTAKVSSVDENFKHFVVEEVEGTTGVYLYIYFVENDTYELVKKISSDASIHNGASRSAVGFPKNWSTSTTPFIVEIGIIEKATGKEVQSFTVTYYPLGAQGE